MSRFIAKSLIASILVVMLTAILGVQAIDMSMCDDRHTSCSTCPGQLGCRPIRNGAVDGWLQCDTIHCQISECDQPGLFALTFDDGVSDNFNELLTKLQAYPDVKVTFFINGDSGRFTNPTKVQWLKSAFQQGHQIASHTWSHPDLTRLSEDKIRAEIDMLANAISTALGVTPRYIRAPYSALNQTLVSLLHEMGLTIMGYNLDSTDYSNHSLNAESILNIFKQALQGKNPAQNSFVSLQHDLLRYSVDAVPMIIQEAINQGYRFVTVAECLGNNPTAYMTKLSSSSSSSTGVSSSSTAQPSSSTAQSSSSSTAVDASSSSSTATISSSSTASSTATKSSSSTANPSSSTATKSSSSTATKSSSSTSMPSSSTGGKVSSSTAMPSSSTGARTESSSSSTGRPIVSLSSSSSGAELHFDSASAGRFPPSVAILAVTLLSALFIIFM